MSVLIHVLVRWWYTTLFLCAGFFDGMSYYLPILGIGRWGFWPSVLPRPTGIYRSWGHFVPVVYIHFRNPLFCVHFSCLFVFLHLLFPRQTVLRKLGVLGRVILFLMAWVSRVCQPVGYLLPLLPSLMCQTMCSILLVGLSLSPKMLVLREEFLSLTAPCDPPLYAVGSLLRMEKILCRIL